MFEVVRCSILPFFYGTYLAFYIFNEVVRYKAAHIISSSKGLRKFDMPSGKTTLLNVWALLCMMLLMSVTETLYQIF